MILIDLDEFKNKNYHKNNNNNNRIIIIIIFIKGRILI